MVTFFRKKVTEKSGGIVVERKTGFVEQQIEVHNQLINSKLDDMSLADCYRVVLNYEYAGAGEAVPT
ncbi:MAG: hypothetical protein KF746_10905 [Chitinophagaceae bacterium]|nr:hypothetical protein [Chitinophagaceae bacterium]